jgi:RNA polymerase sigma-70 factor (ECF subfamily)
MIEGGLATTEREASGDVESERAALFARLADGQLMRSYRLAALLLASNTEADDAVQDAAVIAWERFADLRDRDRFAAWFQRILVNACRDRLRRRGRVRLLQLVAAPPDMSPDASAGYAEREALRGALAGLSHEHREVVVLRYFADLSLEEIAERTGERAGTVKSRLHYGLQALRAAYDAAARLPGETSR